MVGLLPENWTIHHEKILLKYGHSLSFGKGASWGTASLPNRVIYELKFATIGRSCHSQDILRQVGYNRNQGQHDESS